MSASPGAEASRAVWALLLLSWPAPAEVSWARYVRGPQPDGAVVLDRGSGAVTALCRARLADGYVHPGASSNGACAIAQKGKVERVTEFEIAVNGNPQWSPDGWAEASVVGRQGRSDLYFCRAPVRVGGTEAGWVFGKAYREGPHARHCYVAYRDREIDAGPDFEILRIVTPGVPKRE